MRPRILQAHTQAKSLRNEVQHATDALLAARLADQPPTGIALAAIEEQIRHLEELARWLGEAEGRLRGALECIDYRVNAAASQVEKARIDAMAAENLELKARLEQAMAIQR